MDILFIAKEFPHDKVIGGPIIIYNRIKYLSARHTMSLIAFTPHEPTKEQVESVGRYCHDLRLVPPPVDAGILGKFRELFSGPVPPYFLLNYSSEMYRELRDMVTGHKYDVAISEYSMVAQYLYGNADLAGIKRIMSVHECYYLARRKAFKLHGLSREGLSALYYLKGLKRFEFDMYADADKLLALSPEGRNELLEIRPGLDISVVPHGVDVDEFHPVERNPGPPTVMFLGNYPHEPNSDAVVFFCTKVWPIVRETVPDCLFLVVGRGPTDQMRELSASLPGIEITGEVDDVRPYFRRSDVFVCPVRMGGGFRGKVLEAMASGIPVVSTRLGAEGIPAEDGTNILLAETPAELAEKTIAALNQPDMAKRVSQNARELVVDRFSWQTGAGILERVLQEVTGLS